MRSLLKLFVILICGAAAMFFSIRSGAEGTGEAEYTVSFDGGEYFLYSEASATPDPIFKSSSLSSTIDYAIGESENLKIHFFSVGTDSTLNLSYGNITFSGELSFTDGAMLKNSGASLTLSSLTLKFDSGALKIDSGAVYMLSGNLQSEGSAITLNYSAGAYFELISGSISAKSYDSAITLTHGTVKIKGGSIENSLGYAVSNSSSLLLSGSPTLSGSEFDIYSTSPITLEDGNSPYLGTSTVKYGRVFQKGTSTEVFRCSESLSYGGITLFDANSLPCDITHFKADGTAAVYLPFSISYYDSGALIYTTQALSGEIAEKPQNPEKVGYEFLGWSLTEGGELYEFASGVRSDIILYSVYRLTPPSFTLSSLTFSYDGTMHFLVLEEISHPFLDEGILGCEWYRDGVPLSRYGDRIGVRNVSDSGKYKCQLTFSAGRDVVTVFTPEVSVKIEKSSVKIPTIPSATYNGDEIYPEIFDTAAYTVERTPGKNAGIYPIAITLTDRENCKFENSNSATVHIDFEIKKADNYWREEIAATDIYEGEIPNLKATAAFGSIKYLFSDKIDGYYSADIPAKKGIYYVKYSWYGI